MSLLGERKKEIKKWYGSATEELQGSHFYLYCNPHGRIIIWQVDDETATKYGQQLSCLGMVM